MSRAKAKPAAESAESDQPKSQSAIDAMAQARKTAQVARPASTGPTVTVGLKNPHGIVLRIQKKEMVDVPVMGGGTKEIPRWSHDPSYQSYTLAGTVVPFGSQPKCLVVGGYAMTPGIPEDFMELWLQQNMQHDLVVNGMLIVQRKTDSAKAQAKEMAGLRSGLEPVAQKDDPRVPKKLNKETGAVESEIETGQAV